MASILKPHSRLLNPGRLQVPTGPLAIDWTHPLANGLVVCYVPGAMGFVDLCGLVSDPITSLGGGGFSANGITPEGAAWICDSTSGSQPAIVIGQKYSLTSLARFTLYVRGYQYAIVNGFSQYFGINYAYNPNATPFNVYNIGSTNTGLLQIEWNNSGAQQTFTPGPAQSVGPFSYGMNDTPTVYSNGVNVGSTGGGPGGTETSTATSCIQFPQGSSTTADIRAMTIACIWNRRLSDAEMAWVDQYPYDFLTPAEAELPVMFMPPPPPPPLTLMPQILW